ncbi:hypothetical protein LINGRAHAP2_LOCUS7577 [Linum grandiflorum]
MQFVIYRVSMPRTRSGPFLIYFRINSTLRR